MVSGRYVMGEHAVIVRFSYGLRSMEPLFDLEDKLTAAIDEADVGECDGHDVASDLSSGTLYMYGPSADALYEVIRPILLDSQVVKQATVLLRYGPPEDGVDEREIKL
jgi:hypothetical protein